MHTTERPGSRLGSAPLREQLDPVVDEAMAAGRVVGTSVLVAQHGEVLYQRHAGWADREGEKPVVADSEYRLASMTKPIVSAAALAMADQGLLDLDTPVHETLPWFRPRLADGTTPEITVRQLLAHTAGLTYGFLNEDNEPYAGAGVSDGADDSGLTLAENLRRLAEVPLMYAPGTGWGYSLATDVVGAILAEVSGEDLPAVVRRFITGPLGMADTAFTATDPDRLTTAYADSGAEGVPARRMREADELSFRGAGMVRYAPSRATDPSAYPSGGIGMVGTAEDYLAFLETVRTGGGTVLSEASALALSTDAVPEHTVYIGPGFGWSLGFAVIRDPEPTDSPRPAGSYGWGGVYGTHSFVDPIAGLSVVALTNTGLEGMAGAFPMAVEAAVYRALAAPAGDGASAGRTS